MDSKKACANKRVLVKQSQLPLSCPMDDQVLWNAHPKVYLPLKESNGAEIACPYCSTIYVYDKKNKR